ncbi:hypothetical protein LHW04_26735 [Bacillus tropicus]|uniref:Uncharacterized protein n=1 Tax=Bacillus tropicus TaxID=2026188 RepID=A0A5C4ZYZ5_9BACI|nr:MULTISPECIES: hypothetical protein [Bacillus cereus group]MCB4848656.1 hypothetical protein [Bacillus tropicus]PJZ19987.1 hypothetical protein CEW46_20335 [Bacillus cereus]TNP10504.1 hypothetical protein FHY71_27330 [Bacillus tropicus]
MISLLKKKLLLSKWREFVKFVSDNFDLCNSDSLEELNEKKKELAMLDLETIRDVINRTGAINKAFYDLSKGFPVIASVLLFMFTFLLKDYMLIIFHAKSVNELPPVVALFGLVAITVIFLWAFKAIITSQNRNYLLSQFESVLVDIKEQKEKEEEQKKKENDSVSNLKNTFAK